MTKNRLEIKTKMYEKIAFILMKSGVTGPEVDDCLAWAFGPGCLYVPISDWAQRWNKLHGRIFEAKGSDKFVEFIYVCGFMFVLDKKERALKN